MSPAPDRDCKCRDVRTVGRYVHSTTPGKPQHCGLQRSSRFKPRYGAGTTPAAEATLEAPRRARHRSPTLADVESVVKVRGGPCACRKLEGRPIVLVVRGVGAHGGAAGSWGQGHDRGGSRQAAGERVQHVRRCPNNHGIRRVDVIHGRPRRRIRVAGTTPSEQGPSPSKLGGARPVALGAGVKTPRGDWLRVSAITTIQNPASSAASY